jgi:hypothetical protein
MSSRPRGVAARSGVTAHVTEAAENDERPGAWELPGRSRNPSTECSLREGNSSARPCLLC